MPECMERVHSSPGLQTKMPDIREVCMPNCMTAEPAPPFLLTKSMVEEIARS